MADGHYHYDSCRFLRLTHHEIVLMVSQHQPSTEAGRKYGKRLFGVDQQNCMFAMHSLFCCYPPPTHQFLLETISSCPELIELTLDCGLYHRRPWAPELYADEIGMLYHGSFHVKTADPFAGLEVLCMLVQFPKSIVPGLPFPSDSAIDEQLAADWQAAMSSLDVLIRHPDLVSKIVSIWKKLDDETFQDVAT